MEKIYRKLIIERVFLPRPDSFAILIAIFNNFITQNQLILALNNLYKKFPLLNTHIEEDEKHHAWLVSNEKIDISLSVETIKEKDYWINATINEYNSVFPLSTGPLIRFNLLHYQNESILIISGYHLLIDGISLPYLLYNIIEFLKHSPSDIIPHITPPIHELIQLPIKLSLDQKILNQVAKIMWKRREKEGIAFGVKDYMRIHSKYCPLIQNDLTLLPYVFSKEQTHSLIQKCRDVNVSVNSALCCAFFLADQEIFKFQRFHNNLILLSANIRNILSLPEDAIGLYVSTIDIALKYKKKYDFWSFVRNSHNLVQTKLKPEIILNLLGRVLEIPEQIPDAAIFSKYNENHDWFFNLCLKSTKLDKIRYAYSHSNLGKYDFPTDINNIDLQEAYFHTFGEMTEKQLTVITIANKLTLCLSFRNSVLSKEIGEKILDAALKFLFN